MFITKPDNMDYYFTDISEKPTIILRFVAQKRRFVINNMSLVHTLLKLFQVQFFLKAELGIKRIYNMERLMHTKCVLRLVETIMESLLTRKYGPFNRLSFIQCIEGIPIPKIHPDSLTVRSNTSTLAYKNCVKCS